jgi:hypothetical protein
MSCWVAVLLQGYQQSVTLAAASSDLTEWTLYDSVYTVPPPYSNTSHVIVYAAKAHPEYSTSANSIVFSYNSNMDNGQLTPLETDIWLYHPIFVELTVQPADDADDA